MIVPSYDYNKVIELKPDYAHAYNNRGAVYRDRGDYRRAIVDYTKAIELKPDLAGAYHNRGEAWLNLREWEKGEKDLMTARDMG